MARKRKYEFITDPVLKASVVIESFVDKAKVEVGDWAKEYQTKIRSYTADEKRQQAAAAKLAAFYTGLTEPEVRNAIREAVNKAKARQAEIISGVLEKLPVPTVPAAAKSTAAKVAEILGVTVPAV